MALGDVEGDDDGGDVAEEGDDLVALGVVEVAP